MARIRFTKALVDSALPKPKEYFLWDLEVPGLGLKVLPSGKKVFTVFYRNAGGRQRRPVLGAHGILTVPEARRLAIHCLSDVAHGKDPAASRKEARVAEDVRSLTQRYLRDHAELHKKRSSIDQDKRMIERQITPRLGTLKISAVTRPDIIRFQGLLRDTPYEANRCLSLLSKMFNLAELWGLRTDGTNPCRHVKKYPERARDRFFSEEELQLIGVAIAGFRTTHPEYDQPLDAIILLALTGCRLGEIVSLKWSQVNLPASTFDLNDSKTGPKRIPIGAAAVQILEAKKRDGEWVCTNLTTAEPISRWKVIDVWKRVRLAAGLGNARLHDFRHTVGTISGQNGANAFMVRDLLGHRTLAMTNRYVSADLHRVKRIADEVSQEIASLLIPTK